MVSVADIVLPVTTTIRSNIPNNMTPKAPKSLTLNAQSGTYSLHPVILFSRLSKPWTPSPKQLDPKSQTPAY